MLRAVAGDESWVLDFFSHLDPIRDYCTRHEIPFREASKRSLVIPASALTPEKLEALVDRFQKETFGARAGALAASGDASLEGDLARRGVDAYHNEFKKYFLCAICSFDDGSMVLLSEKLWASEVIGGCVRCWKRRKWKCGWLREDAPHARRWHRTSAHAWRGRKPFGYRIPPLF